MDSDEETALAAIIIATFTENIKGKKGVKKRNGFQRRQDILETFLSFLISYNQFLIFSILFDFAIFTPPNLPNFSTPVFSEIYYTFCFEKLLHVNF